MAFVSLERNPWVRKRSSHISFPTCLFNPEFPRVLHGYAMSLFHKVIKTQVMRERIPFDICYYHIGCNWTQLRKCVACKRRRHLKQVTLLIQHFRQSETRNPVCVHYHKSSVPLPFRPTSRNQLFCLLHSGIDVLFVWPAKGTKQTVTSSIRWDHLRQWANTVANVKEKEAHNNLCRFRGWLLVRNYSEFHTFPEAVNPRGLKAIYIWTAEVNLLS